VADLSEIFRLNTSQLFSITAQIGGETNTPQVCLKKCALNSINFVFHNQAVDQNFKSLPIYFAGAGLQPKFSTR
jgi:hypothetical protein